MQMSGKKKKKTLILKLQFTSKPNSELQRKSKQAKGKKTKF